MKKTVEDSTVGVKTAEVLRFNTSKPGDEQNSSEQYVDRMKEGQNNMCYVTDESIAVVSSLFEENLRKKGHEVPYMADPVDEKKTLEELKAKLEPLTELMKEVLGDKVEEAIVDDRTVDLLRVLTTSRHGLSVNMKRIMKAQAPVDNANVSMNAFDRLERQQHSSKQQQQPQTARQPTRQEREEERETEKGRGEQVKKDVTDWTVVTRNRRQRKMVQIFVRVNGSKATPMEVNLTDDKVEDVMRQIQKDEDVYVTMHGKVLRRDEKLKSCEVTDGCTIQVTSRLRGGGKHKVKRSKADTKQGMEESGKKDQQVGSMSDKCQEMTKDQKDALIQTIERNEGYRRLITTISEAEDLEYKIQRFGKQLQEKSEIGKERAKVMEWGMRWAVEARKRRRDEEQGQSMGQEEDKKAESTDELKMMSRSEEVRTGRGSACLVQRTDEKCLTNEIYRKGKGKGNGGKGEHGRKGGEGNKGAMHVENLVMDEDQENMRATTSEENQEMELEMMQQEEMEHEEQRGRMAPNMGAGGSHPQATSDPRKKKKETSEMRWADCEDDERQEEGKKEQETEKETRQETGREEQRRAQEAQEEHKRAQEAREKEKRAQEAREEERKAQEARGEERRAQEAREQKRVQEAQAREAKAQEEREREMKDQEEREREVSAH